MVKKTVLIVDDSSLARMMMRKIFAQFYPDWEVIDAKDGAEALAMATQHAIQLAFIDYNMPGINGIELSVQLLDKVPTLVIHLVTANIQQKMQERAEAMGLGFIKKPISPDKIKQIIATLPTV